MNELVYCYDNLLSDKKRRELNKFLHENDGPVGWKFGWKTRENFDTFSFWHRHFAGYRDLSETEPYNCESELVQFPILLEFWKSLTATKLQGHRLIRCYANGHTYGNEGTVHIDAIVPHNYTCIYYAHEHWNPDWAGETLFFNNKLTDVIAAIYPLPNRFIVFDGTVSHVARGVSRSCPILRITLIFKTDMANG